MSMHVAALVPHRQMRQTVRRLKLEFLEDLHTPPSYSPSPAQKLHSPPLPFAHVPWLILSTPGRRPPQWRP
jgi:hypothetical protein